LVELLDVLEQLLAARNPCQDRSCVVVLGLEPGQHPRVFEILHVALRVDYLRAVVIICHRPDGRHRRGSRGEDEFTDCDRRPAERAVNSTVAEVNAQKSSRFAPMAGPPFARGLANLQVLTATHDVAVRLRTP
jgi:hypothetical protein